MQHIPKVPGLANFSATLPKDAFAKLLNADSSGHEMLDLYHKSHMALAGLIPVGFLSGEGSYMTRVCDMGLALAVPLHSHVSMNAIVSDYLPYAYRTPARYGLLGATGVMTLGLLKLNLFGPGITDTIRLLWKSAPPAEKK